MTENKPVKRTAHREYDEATRQRAFREIAACSGNTRMASRRLAAAGIDVPHQTLYVWKRKEEYARVRAEALPQIQREAADRHRAQEDMDLALTLAASERILAEIPQMEHKDLINAKHKADVGSGIHADKAQMYDGEPTVIVQKSSVEILRKMKSIGLVIEGEAEEIEDPAE